MDDKAIHYRRSIRLWRYDYARSGAYYVTVCVQGMLNLFGQIVEGQMAHNSFGKIVSSCWNDLPRHYADVELDSVVVMPSHVHGIIVIREPSGVPAAGAGLKPAPAGAAPLRPRPLSEIVRGFKTFSARRINEMRITRGTAVWQRNYFERIIRNDDELNKIREYINTNPLRAETGWENILGS